MAALKITTTESTYGGIRSSEDVQSDVDTTNSVSTDTPRHQEKLYLVPAMASCVGKLASVAVRAKLDSGAEAANWIEPALVTKLRLRKRKILEKERRIYTNRLFTSSKGYSPEEMVSVKVYFQDWNFAIDITCCVFPELSNPMGMPQEEIIIGDVD